MRWYMRWYVVFDRPWRMRISGWSVENLEEGRPGRLRCENYVSKPVSISILPVVVFFTGYF